MNLTKIIGWVTFLTGIIIIGTTLYLTYNIFIGEVATPQLLSFKSSSQQVQQEPVSGLGGELQKMLSNQIENIIPTKSIEKISNLAVWAAGAWILIFGGSKISELGIKLISVPVDKET